MEEEGSDRVRLVIGAIVVLIILVIGFFVIRGLFTKKATPAPESAKFPTIVTPTPYGTTPTPTPTIVPSNQKTTKGGLPLGSTGATGSTGTNTTSTVWYYQSQSSANSQGNQTQNQDNSSQSQTQTLPNGFTQTQSQ